MIVPFLEREIALASFQGFKECTIIPAVVTHQMHINFVSLVSPFLLSGKNQWKYVSHI